MSQDRVIPQGLHGVFHVVDVYHYLPQCLVEEG